MESEATPKRNEVVAVDVELPAPKGWKKKFTPKKGGTPRRKDVVFISPDGEEIKSKRKLEQYLKSHPENPPATEFDWGTGDTPRRSSRLSEISKAMETPESESPKKRQKKSSSEKEAKGKKDESDAEDETTEAAAEENKETVEIAMEDSQDNEDLGEGEVVTSLGDKEDVKDTTEKTHERVVTEEVPDKDEVKETMEIIDETMTKEPENQETFDLKEEVAAIDSLPTPDAEGTHKDEMVIEEVIANKNDLKNSTGNIDETEVGKSEKQDIENISLPMPGLEEGSAEAENKSLTTPGFEEDNKEAKKEPVLTEPATSEQDTESKHEVPEVAADTQQDGDAKAGQEGHHKEKVAKEGNQAEAKEETDGLKDNQFWENELRSTR